MFYAMVHKYDRRYGDDDVIELHRFKKLHLRDNFVAGDRKHRSKEGRCDAMGIDKAAFRCGANWFSLNDEHEQWICDREIMDKPEPILMDPLTYQQLKSVAKGLRDTCWYECGSYINELAGTVLYLVNTLEYSE